MSRNYQLCAHSGCLLITDGEDAPNDCEWTHCDDSAHSNQPARQGKSYCGGTTGYRFAERASYSSSQLDSTSASGRWSNVC